MWKAAVLGLGKIGLMYDFEPGRSSPASHALAYHLDKDFTLVMGADPELQRGSDLREVAPEAAYYTQTGEGLYQTQPDVISICTPPHLHLSQIVEIFELVRQPRLIFCEKPLATNRAEARAVRDLCDKYPQTVLVPNISRRWSAGLRKVTEALQHGEYGRLQKIHVRYTRGIYNTGAHLFDLLHMWTGRKIKTVQVLKKVSTSSDMENEPSYTFFFEQEDGVYGYAEAMDDRQYYLFEIDLYTSGGKIEMRCSGDEVRYYRTAPHHLFAGFEELQIVREEQNLLSEPLLGEAVRNLAGVLAGEEQPACQIDDAIYSLYVAEALEKSYRNESEEKVDDDE